MLDASAQVLIICIWIHRKPAVHAHLALFHHMGLRLFEYRLTTHQHKPRTLQTCQTSGNWSSKLKFKLVNENQPTPAQTKTYKRLGLGCCRGSGFSPAYSQTFTQKIGHHKLIHIESTVSLKHSQSLWTLRYINSMFFWQTIYSFITETKTVCLHCFQCKQSQLVQLLRHAMVWELRMIWFTNVA